MSRGIKHKNSEIKAHGWGTYKNSSEVSQVCCELTEDPIEAPEIVYAAIP